MAGAEKGGEKTNRKTLVFALLFLLVLTLIPTTVSLFAATPAASADTGWTLVNDAREMKGYSDLREYVWQKIPNMLPNEQYDKIGLHRLIKQGITPKGVFLSVSGSSSSGEAIISNPPTDSFAKNEESYPPIYWANRGFDVYYMDQRSHFVPTSLNASQLSFMANWGWDQWISDIREAVLKVKEISGAQKIFMAVGGNEAPLNYATLYPNDLAGIIMLEPSLYGIRASPVAIKHGSETNTFNLTKEIATMNSFGNWSSPVGGWSLFKSAADDPGAPVANETLKAIALPLINPLTNKTWANVTEASTFLLQFAYGSAFGGALSNVYGGYGNATSDIRFLSQADRYGLPARLKLESQAMADWVNCPYLTRDFDDNWNKINVPLISFNSQLFSNMTGTFRYVNGIGTDDFTGVMLPKYGQLDVVLGTYASRDVYQPVLDWMVNHLPPDLTLFGNKGVGTAYDQNDANAQSVSYFTCTKTGQATDIMAYINGASAGNCIAAIYAFDGGSAGALLAQSNPVSINTTFSWVDFKLPTPYKVNAGTIYGLAIMGDVAVNIMEVSGTGQRDHNAVSSYANGFANPFGSIWGTDDRGAMSIYAVNLNNQIINYGTGSLVYLNLPTPSNATSPPAAPGIPSHPTDIQLRCYHFDQDSSFGAFDAILVYLWMPQRNSYNPVAFITDTSNPQTYQGVWNQTFIWYNPTSGANDTHNVIQVADNDLQIYTEQSSNAFIVNLTKAVTIKLPFNAWTGSAQTYGNLTFTLPPMTLKFRPIAEAYSDLGTNALLPSGYYRQPIAGMRTPAWVEETIPTWLGSTSPLEVVGHIDYKFTEIITPPKA